GCTAWFSFVPIDVDPPFAPIESYDPFFNLDYVAPGLKRLNFVEVQNVTENVRAIFEREAPFTDLVIPASGPTMRAVGLGIMIGFFLAVGIVPDCTSSLVSSGPDCSLNLFPSVLALSDSTLSNKLTCLMNGFHLRFQLRSYVSKNNHK